MKSLAPILLLTTAFFVPLATAQEPYSYSSEDVPLAGDVDGNGKGYKTLADLTADEIASDVRTEFSPRTGHPELVGPTFDPFEQDDQMAAQVSLRTVESAVDLDGQVLTDGVLLDVSIFYSSDPDSRYGRTRDAIFLNGEPASIILSDRKELECSSRVTETIYSRDYYYNPGQAHYSGLHRPAPVYLHFGFGGFDRYYRGGRHYRRRGGYGYRPGGYWDDQPYWRRRDRRRRPDRPSRRDREDQRTYPDIGDTDDSGVGRPRRQRDYNYRAPDGSKLDKTDRTTDRPRRPRTDRPRRTDRPHRTDRPRRSDRTAPTVRRPSSPNRTGQPQLVAPDVRVSPGIQSDQPSVRRPDRRPEVRRPSRRQTGDKPRRERDPVSRVRNPKPKPAPKPAPKPKVVRKPQPVPTKPRPPKSKPPINVRRDPNRVRTSLEFFPRDQYDYSSSVVTSSRDCAYEDRVKIFIPRERLEAARFDGLTVFVRDISYDPNEDLTTVYDEQVIHVPPNYIEGFRQAISRTTIP